MSGPARPGTGKRAHPAGAAVLLDRLADGRGRRVVFVSHCLLNENVRYLGGATCAGAVPDVLDRYAADGVGLYQMPCPEQHAWGGVLKRRMNRFYGSRVLRSGPVRRAVLAPSLWWTQAIYRRLARHVATDVSDYIGSGFEVVGIVGVGASPSCGVCTTVDLDGAVDAMARSDPATIDRRTVNRCVVAANVIGGEGMFIAALRRQLGRRGVNVSFREHDLIAELRADGRGW